MRKNICKFIQDLNVRGSGGSGIILMANSVFLLYEHCF
jgi:hypothetical protein